MCSEKELLNLKDSKLTQNVYGNKTGFVRPGHICSSPQRNHIYEHEQGAWCTNFIRAFWFPETAVMDFGLHELYPCIWFAQARMFLCFTGMYSGLAYSKLNKCVHTSVVLVNPLTRICHYSGIMRNSTEIAYATIVVISTRNQTNCHAFNPIRPIIKVFIYYYSPLNSVQNGRIDKNLP